MIPSARQRPRLGIGITTYNRRNKLRDLLGRLERFTSVEFDLVVADDGSSDGTADILADARFPSVIGRNRGIAWNKNRCVYHLMNRTAADIVLLLDDDVQPRMFGWEQEWIAAASSFGHINFAPPHIRHHVLSGACRADEPGATHIVGGQCLGFTRAALLHVGYFDPRFGQYGHEHADVSLRCLRAGFGGVRQPTFRSRRPTSSSSTADWTSSTTTARTSTGNFSHATTSCSSPSPPTRSTGCPGEATRR